MVSRPYKTKIILLRNTKGKNAVEEAIENGFFKIGEMMEAVATEIYDDNYLLSTTIELHDRKNNNDNNDYDKNDNEEIEKEDEGRIKEKEGRVNKKIKELEKFASARNKFDLNYGNMNEKNVCINNEKNINDDEIKSKNDEIDDNNNNNNDNNNNNNNNNNNDDESVKIFNHNENVRKYSKVCGIESSSSPSSLNSNDSVSVLKSVTVSGIDRNGRENMKCDNKNNNKNIRKFPDKNIITNEENEENKYKHKYKNSNDDNHNDNNDLNYLNKNSVTTIFPKEKEIIETSSPFIKEHSLINLKLNFYNSQEYSSKTNKTAHHNENKNKDENEKEEVEEEEGEFSYDDNADTDEYSFALAPKASQALGYYGVQKGRDRDSSGEEEKDGNGENDNNED